MFVVIQKDISRHGISDLVHNDEEEAIHENGPDEDVAEDTGYERCRVRHHDSSVPVNGNERPCQRRRHNWRVDKPSIPGVSEVERGQVDEVQDDHHLRPGEMRAHEEHDEGKVEQVVDDWSTRD